MNLPVYMLLCFMLVKLYPSAFAGQVVPVNDTSACFAWAVVALFALGLHDVLYVKKPRRF
jgi:hypothetical protein